MDPIVSALVNNGGFALLAAVLYLLHQSNVKNFIEQQKEERQLFRQALDDERTRADRQLEMHLEHHEEVMNGIRSIRCQGQVYPPASRG